MINKRGIIITALFLIVAGVLSYLISGWITGEFKAANSKTILKSLESTQQVIDNRIVPLEHFYGKKPEILLLTPKDVNLITLPDTESGEIVKIIAGVRKDGYKFSLDVFPVGLSGAGGFDDLSQQLYRQSHSGGVP